MALESGTYISDLVATNPTSSDAKSQGDDHLRFLKSTVKATFPNISGAVTPTHTELNFVDGVTSAIQAQLDAKAPIASPTFTGTPVAPTATAGTSTTQIATTAFVANTSFASALPNQTGNSGKFVTTDGTTASWSTVNAALVYLSTVTASAAATVDIETGFGSTYDDYLIVASGIYASSANTTLLCRLKIGGAYAALYYSYHTNTSSSSAATYNGVAAATQAQIQIGQSDLLSSSSGLTADFCMTLLDVNGASYKGFFTNGRSGYKVTNLNCIGHHADTGVLSGVRLYAGSGNLTGTFKLYGIKKS